MAVDFLHSLFTNAWSVFLVALFLGGSIFVHELGHFLVARKRGLHVERFSIGFGPAIWSHRAADGVEYCVAWFPFGGYVLLPQLADLGELEGPSSVTAAQLPPVSYTSRLLVLVAGASCNVIFAFVLATVIWAVGQRVDSDMATTRIGHVSAVVTQADGTEVASPAALGGLQAGDIVRAIDGRPVADWPAVTDAIVTGSGRTKEGRPEAIFTVERDGRRLTLPVHPRLTGEDQARQVGISPWLDFVVERFSTPEAPAQQLGFQAGDRILSFDGRPIHDPSDYFSAFAGNRTHAMVARIGRGDRELEIAIPPQAGETLSPPLGLVPNTSWRIVHPSPLAQIDDQIVLTIHTLGSLLNPRSDVGLSKMSGPIGISHIFYTAAEAGLRVIIAFTIFVNINLAIINLLPIPVLDGGQILMATLARLRGRALPLRFVVATQGVFVALIVTMFVYLSISDVRRWVRDAQADKAATAAPAAPLAKP